MVAIDTVKLSAKRDELSRTFRELCEAGRFIEAREVNAEIERIDAIVC